MNRIRIRVRTIAIAVPIGLAIAGLAACSSNVSGHGSTTKGAASSAVTSSSAATTSSAPTIAVVATAPPASASTSAASTSAATTSAVIKPPAPQFGVLKVTFDKVCAPLGGVTSVEASVVWQVSHATGIKVGIDDTNPGDAAAYSGASGSADLTSIACGTGNKYTFDVWTVGGAAGQTAHQQLTYIAS